jgi:hypothetical protein
MSDAFQFLWNNQPRVPPLILINKKCIGKAAGRWRRIIPETVPSGAEIILFARKFTIAQRAFFRQ